MADLIHGSNPPTKLAESFLDGGFNPWIKPANNKQEYFAKNLLF